jgi:hypothetical protein
MSGATTAAIIGGGALLGAGASMMLAPKPKAPKVQAPEPPPQAPKAPDQAAARAGAATGGPRGGLAPATMLTGAAGIDATALNLGKNTLLGS